MVSSNKLIFLDIDGVLDYQKWFSNPIRKHLPGGKYAMENTINRRNLFWVGLLCRLTNAKVIMSSSWRYAWDDNTGLPLSDNSGRSIIKTDKLFRKYGVNVSGTTGNCIDKLENDYELDESIVDHYTKDNKFEDMGLGMTRKTFLSYARGSQILDWIERNKWVGKFIILDDDISDIKVYKTLENHIVKSSFYGHLAGFGFKQFLRAIWKLEVG